MAVTEGLGDVVSDTRAALTAPFLGTVSVWELFLATGMVLIFAGLWGIILWHIRMAAREIV